MNQYITDCGYTLVIMWECEWKTYKRGRTINNRYMYPTEHIYRMGEDQLLNHIKNGDIFGAVEVDIEVIININIMIMNCFICFE